MHAPHFPECEVLPKFSSLLKLLGQIRVMGREPKCWVLPPLQCPVHSVQNTAQFSLEFQNKTGFCRLSSTFQYFVYNSSEFSV